MTLSNRMRMTFDIFVGYTDDNPLSIDTKDDLEKIRKIL